jgi:hypothetical protein
MLYFHAKTIPQSHVVLHPRHKLSYFKTAGWTADWIKTPENLVHDEFDSHYARIVVDAGPEIETVETSITTKVCGILVQLYSRN